MTQNEIAKRMGISKAMASRLKSRGMPVHKGLEACIAWRRENSPGATEKPTAAEQPAPAAAESKGLSYAAEQAALARSRRVAQELKNSVAAGEYAPVSLLEATLGDVARQIAARLATLVPNIRRRLPDLPMLALDVIVQEVTACRAMCASVRVTDAARSADEDEAE